MYYFDAHCDFLYNSVKKRDTMLSEAAVRQSGLKKSIFAVFQGDGKNDVEAQISRFNAYNGIPEAYLAYEGLTWVNSLFDAEYIIKTKPLYTAPVWNNKNSFGGSCRDDAPLTQFGMCFLYELSHNGIYIDLAHSGKTMFYSCIERFDNVMFSHGNVFEICKNPRNIDKHRIKLLIEKKSFFGMSLYTAFVGGNSLDLLLNHIDFVLEAGGEDILGIGSDIDGCPSIVGDTQDASVFSKLYRKMVDKGYSENIINKITHENLERLLFVKK